MKKENVVAAVDRHIGVRARVRVFNRNTQRGVVANKNSKIQLFHAKVGEKSVKKYHVLRHFRRQS